MHNSFNIMGLPVWFGYLIGACELAGAIGLFVRKLSVLAASGLSIIMLGAIFLHINYEVTNHVLPAFMLLVFLLIIIFRRRNEADDIDTGRASLFNF